MKWRLSMLDRLCYEKRGWPNRTLAKRARRERSQWFGRHYRIYRCPICGYWHLSTRRSDA